MEAAATFRRNASRAVVGVVAALILASVAGNAATDTNSQRNPTEAAVVEADVRHSQAIALIESADALLALGNLEEALAPASQARSILQDMLAAEPHNVRRLHDLWLSDNKLGDILAAAGQFDEALAAYRNSFAIINALVENDGRNTGWQHDLSVNDNKIGDLLLGQGHLDDALATYRNSFAIIKALVQKDRTNTQWQGDLQLSIDNIGDLAFRFVLTHEFKKALEISDEAISLAPEKIWLHMNRSHALMFLGRVDEARELYLRNCGEVNVVGERSYEKVLLEDFAELRKAGLTHPLMDAIEKQLAKRG